MVWYQYKDQYPTNGLPNRIRIVDGEESGETRTSLWKYSDSELESFGITKVSDPPNYDDRKQDLIWNNETSSWSVGVTTNSEKILYAWEQNKYYKDHLKVKLLEKVVPYILTGGSISTHFDNAIKILDSIDSSNYDNPFAFNWQHPVVIGYTEDVVVGITSAEYSLINHAFVDFITEDYLPNQTY
jgi:hypothetical protein